MKQRVVILGSTGSIGRQSLSVLESLPDHWEVVGLATGTRCDALAQQANQFRPGAIAVAHTDDTGSLTAALDYSPTVYAGEDALLKLVNEVAFDVVISAVVGVGGLAATLQAVAMGKRIALANKEALVIAGSILMPLAANSGATIIPVDSEHSAIFQAMHAGRREDVEKVYLTASGGPFRTWSEEALAGATLEDALQHPTWDMGPKITIDSATMMNKALEIVEARWLFDLNPETITVVVHPESIVHSLVEYADGSIMAQMGTPDMRTPIQYALTYPERRACPSGRLDMCSLHKLHFFPLDKARFPAVQLGYDAARRGGTAGAVLNAANERAVELFRNEVIGYQDIVRLTDQALRTHHWKESPTLDELLAADNWARSEVAKCITC